METMFIHNNNNSSRKQWCKHEMLFFRFPVEFTINITMRKTASANISQSALLATRNVYQLRSSLEADVLPVVLSYIPYTESNDFFNYLLYSLNETLGKCLKKDKKSNGYHNILCFFQTAIDRPQTTFPLFELPFQTSVTEGLRSQHYIVLIGFQKGSRLNILECIVF